MHVARSLAKTAWIWVCALTFSVTAFADIATQEACPQMVSVRLLPEELVQKPVSPLIYGNFIELGFGRQAEGLWAEMLFNRSFEEVPPYRGIHWFWLKRSEKDDLSKEVWWHSGYEEKPWYLVRDHDRASWQIVEHGGFRHGQSGAWVNNESTDKPASLAQDGIHLRRGETYRFSAALRVPNGMWDLGPNDSTSTVEVRLYEEGKLDRPLAVREIPHVNGVYGYYECEFPLLDFEGRATLAISIPPASHLNIDDCSLMPASNMDGWRREAIEATQQLKPPIIRWPGGCFASFYQWREGIGHRRDRSPHPSAFWGGLNDNDVGTVEFMRFCRLVGALPFVCVNMLTATPEDAAEWVAYCNAPASHPIGALRQRDGHEAPFGVTYWELDNEAYRKYGPLEYAEKCVAWSRAMKAVDPNIKTVMLAYANYLNDLPRMLDIAGKDIDYVTDRSIDEPTLRRDLEIIRTYNAKAGTSIGLCNTEWLAQMSDVPVKADAFNMQPLPEEDTFQNKEIRWKYAMNAARQLLLFQRLGGDFHFANFNNFANTWGQNVLECPKEGVYLSAAGRVFELLTASPAAWPIRIDVQPLRDDVIVQAAWDGERRELVVEGLNYSAQPIRLELDPTALGRSFSEASVEILHAPSLDAYNTLNEPQSVVRSSTVATYSPSDPMVFTLPPYAVLHATCR